MNPVPPNQPQRVGVFRSHTRRECVEMRLVLDAMGMDATISRQTTGHDAGDWELQVWPRDVAAAKQELDAYQAERAVDITPTVEPIALFEGAGWGILIYVLFLISIEILSRADGYGWGWTTVGPLRAGEVTNGRWWQTITALTLHADLAHLSSNLLFGSLFGFLAGRVLGGGVAWLIIIVAGSIGNGFNAMVRSPDHISIGASTAVFAALGILVAHALYPRAAQRDTAFQRYSPLIAGVVMLAFLGTEGERTDVLAHVTGFTAGLVIGSIGRYFPRRWLENPQLQLVAGGVAIALIVIAWSVAIATRT
ncbi:rhomboid family intramembrane serine protease [Neorhodopirellula pilleata]|uniref:Rhomboid family protein n=1 Tax=Neorhodopirellula pilleata TaxID=2714738 RepID=A0A5C6AR33_9BACT|nr:rhomboid family intramembrane serine protease [Neorhodopirellula pilleata]TWU01526.1 Rhomboid family protein [Neorhodopirellula pilleata]